MIESEIIREIKKISLNDEHLYSFLAKYIMGNIFLILEITIKKMFWYSYTLVTDDQLKTIKSLISLINDIFVIILFEVLKILFI